jgi:GT2 family glycosyltransferase
MGNEAKIGVVTVTYNSAQVLDGFLSSLLRQSHTDFLLYVVDNASSDDTLKHLARYDDCRILLIANQKNVGVARGNNQGIRAALEAGCDSVLLINNDTEFGPELLANLADGLDRFECDMVAPKILHFDNPEIIWSAGGGFNRLKGYAGFHYGLGQPDDGKFDSVRKVDHAPTCCLLVRKAVFSRVGTMDQWYFVYIDDADFCYRAKRQGMRLMYLPHARLLHKVSSLTGGAQSEFSIRYCARNHVYFILKNLGPWRSLVYLPAYQLHLIGKFAIRRINGQEFFLREKAFCEGLRLWKLSLEVIHETG